MWKEDGNLEREARIGLFSERFTAGESVRREFGLSWDSVRLSILFWREGHPFPKSKINLQCSVKRLLNLPGAVLPAPQTSLRLLCSGRMWACPIPSAGRDGSSPKGTDCCLHSAQRTACCGFSVGRRGGAGGLCSRRWWARAGPASTLLAS